VAAAAALVLVALPTAGAHAADTTATTSVAGSSNTGIPSSVKPKVYYGDLTIKKAGTVINGLDIRGLVRVEAANVTIKNSIVRGKSISSNKGLIYSAGSTNLVVQDVTLAPSTKSPYINGIYGYNFTLRRVEITNVVDAVHIFGNNVKVYDSWLHDNLHYDKDPNWNGHPSHDDSIQIQKGYGIHIAGNTISGAFNAAMQVTQDAGKVGSIVFERNRVSGGSCSLNVAQKSLSAITGSSIRNNVFGTSRSNCNMILDYATKVKTSITGNTRTDGKKVSIVSR